MPVLAQVFALVAAALHVVFFYAESVTFARPTTWRRFGLSTQEQAEIVRPMAFNQGFYNLFLAGGIVVGLGLIAIGSTDAGEPSSSSRARRWSSPGSSSWRPAGDDPGRVAAGRPAAARDHRHRGPRLTGPQGA